MDNTDNKTNDSLVFKDSLIFKNEFARFGIKKVEQIIMDNTYGNYIFKGPENVTIFDPEKNLSKELFKNINLTESYYTKIQ